MGFAVYFPTLAVSMCRELYQSPFTSHEKALRIKVYQTYTAKIMRSLYLSLAATSAAICLSPAEPVFTKPVGYTTQTLAANVFSVVGINVQTPKLAAGQLTAVSGANVTDTNVDFTSVLPSGKMCVIEITSGNATGTVQEFTVWTGNTITLPTAVAGVAIGDNYSVRVTPTLQSTFPVGLLTGAIVAGSADKVWVPTGPGTYTKYWYKSIAPNVGWHTTTTGSNDTGLVSGDIPLVYIDAVLVEKKGVAASLVLSGEVKTTGSNVLISAGFNPISIVSPTGLTLFTAGLSGDITGAVVAGSADKVWVPTGTGTYTKYWYKSIAPNIGWHTTTTGSNDTGLVVSDVNLPAGVFIQKVSGSKVISFDVPTSYSGL